MPTTIVLEYCSDACCWWPFIWRPFYLLVALLMPDRYLHCTFLFNCSFTVVHSFYHWWYSCSIAGGAGNFANFILFLLEVHFFCAGGLLLHLICSTVGAIQPDDTMKYWNESKPIDWLVMTQICYSSDISLFIQWPRLETRLQYRVMGRLEADAVGILPFSWVFWEGYSDSVTTDVICFICIDPMPDACSGGVVEEAFLGMPGWPIYSMEGDTMTE